MKTEALPRPTTWEPGWLKGQWIALLNNDAFPSPGWLDSLVSTAAKISGLYLLCLLSDHGPSG